MNDLKVLTDENFDKINNSKSIIIDIYADWCGPCKMLTPIIEDLSKEYSDRIDFYKANMDDNSSLIEKYSIASLPTILFIKDEELKERITGLKTKKDLEKIIESLI